MVGAWLLKGWVRALLGAVGFGAGGFVLSAGCLARQALPLAVGLIVSLPGLSAVAAALGAAAGYWFFWQRAGLQGMVLSAAGGLLGALLGGCAEAREQKFMIPAIAAFLTALTGLLFRLLFGEGTGPGFFAVGVILAFFSATVFSLALEKRGTAADWLAGLLLCLSLRQLAPNPWLDPGLMVGAWISVTGGLPGAVLAGVGLDLAGEGGMTAALALSWIMGLLPLEKRWLRFLFPGIAWGFLSLAAGEGGFWAVPALTIGGLAGFLTPPRPEIQPRRGQTGVAQVRLELGAQVFAAAGRLLAEASVPSIDEGAILRQACQRACGNCSARNVCRERDSLTLEHLHNPLEVDCRKQGRLLPELRRGRDQLRLLRADHRRRGEYRQAVLQQYRFLGVYLRELADDLPRRDRREAPAFRVEAGVRSLGREKANGDRCLAFPGVGCRYYIALCDGMGTGAGAAQAGVTAGKLLRGLLRAGFPARHALESLNSLMILGENPGAATVDLAEIHLDTGYATLYKWGAAQSVMLTESRGEKIGTATPPPGLGLDETCQAVEKLSLRRGEVLVLLSDGVDGEEITRQAGQGSQGPPGELAARLLKAGCGRRTDDATVAVIRLRPVTLAP